MQVFVGNEGPLGSMQSPNLRFYESISNCHRLLLELHHLGRMHDKTGN